MDASNLKSLNEGTRAAKTLTEILKVDFALLAKSTIAGVTKQQLSEIDSLKSIGILKRMDSVSKILNCDFNEKMINTLKSSPSDTVRGWAAFMIGQTNQISFEKKLKLIRPFADDSHFGVREWAWMAIRTDIINNLQVAIKTLKTWTKDESPRIRRFASESIRPRGVWAAHIKELKEKPELAISILESLRSDPDKYVQDSVGNWLNDAAKDNPEWVMRICLRWEKESPGKETEYILKRARRNFKMNKKRKIK